MCGVVSVLLLFAMLGTRGVLEWVACFVAATAILGAAGFGLLVLFASMS